MMSRFTEKAQEALQTAQQIMFRKGHRYLDAEHIFMALLQQRNSIPAEIIRALRRDADKIIQSLEDALNAIQNFDTATRGSPSGYITLRANRVLQGAADEADRLDDEFISTEHLFIAIAAEQSGQSGRILSQTDIDQDKVRKVIVKMRQAGKAEPHRTESGFSRQRSGFGSDYSRPVGKSVITPASLVKPVGFSHGISAAGRFVFLAGQIAVDSEGKLVAPGDVVEQYRQVLRNLQAVVDEAGGQMSDIVKLTMYVKDRDDYRAHLKELGRVHKDFFGSYYPATALVEISRFFEEGALIEIEGIAVLA
jgi:enamine deaminase RidA (YjgF/YER057c/UK114 family)